MQNDSHITSIRKLRVFLCHASEDKPVVRDIYQKLVHYNIEPWLDEKNLLPGENWEQLIPDVLHLCDVVLLCLSRTFLKKEGYGQYEVRTLLEVAKLKPPGTIYLIPFRLEECDMPSYLHGIHYASHFIPEDFERLILALEKRRDWLNAAHGMNIEPLYRRVSQHVLDSQENSGYAAHQMPPPSVPDNKEAHGASLLNSAAPLSTPLDLNIQVEYFDVTMFPNPINVFLSYVHEDEWLRRRLEAHLSPLKREGLISTWCDRQIMPGVYWAGVIDQHLEQASLILLLVSADFLASDYCYQNEVKRALERHQAGEAIVIPIVMRPVDWKQTPFAQLQALPSEAKAITDWSNQDKAFVDVVSGIRKVVVELVSRSPNAPSVIREAGASMSPLVSERKPQEASSPIRQNDPGPDAAWSEHHKIAMGRKTDPQVSSERVKPARPSRGVRFGAPFPAVWNVVRRHNPFFTGRDHVLEELFEGFGMENEGGMIPLRAISALGGMGKTQTAAEYAYRFRENYQAVLWVRAETQENLLADFQTIARLLNRPQEDLQERENLMQTMSEWFLEQTRWLLVLDNADNLALVEPFLPLAARGHILFTTRAGATAGQAQALQLEPLGTDDGALCILRRAGILAWNKYLEDAQEASVEAARQLAYLMDGLPLALEQAGAYINDTACGVRRYLRLYQQYRSEIQTIHHGAVPDYPEAVASAWRISRNAVEQSSPAATELLRLCAYLAPEAIPDELLTVGASALGPVLGPVVANPVAFDQIIRLLRTYSLLHREVDRQTDLTRLSMHRIMQEILLDEMDEADQQLWAERAICAVAQSLPVLPRPVLQSHAHNCLQFIERWQMTFPEAKLLRQWVEQASMKESC